MHFALASFAAVAAATLVTAQPRAREALSFNPPDVPKVEWKAIVAAPAPVEQITNAKRFELKMPPLKPKAHRRSPHRGGPHRDHPKGTRVQSAPRAATSPLPPAAKKCNIKATGTDGTDFGFIAPVWNGFGEYGQFQSVQDGALEVSFSYSPDSASQLDMTATNSPSGGYPFFGAIVGYASTDDNFSVGSYNYAYLGGTTQTPAGSPPFTEGDNSFSVGGIPADIESAIWSYDSATQAITAQWINLDGSAPATHIIFVNDENKALAIAGDVAAFQDAFAVPYPEVLFTCVPPSSASVTPA